MFLSAVCSCNVRAHLAQYIEHCRDLAIRRGDEDTQLDLRHTNEGELYGVFFGHGGVHTKFYRFILVTINVSFSVAPVGARVLLFFI